MKANWIGLIGTKDQVGTSETAYQLAEKLHQKRDRVLLFDADPDYVGDLQLLGGEDFSWETVVGIATQFFATDQEKIVSHLKSPSGFSVLRLVEDRKELKRFSFEKSSEVLQGLSPYFDWIIADLGSRRHPVTEQLLSHMHYLLLILKTNLALVQEAKRKCEELVGSDFSSQQIGWFASEWNADSFITIDSVSQYIKIPLEGESVAILADRLKKKKFLQPHFQWKPTDTSFKARLLQKIQKRLEEEGIRKKECKDWEERIRSVIKIVLDENRDTIPTVVGFKELTDEFSDEILGLGPLESLMDNPQYTEILVNGCEEIYVEEKGRLKKTDRRFSNEDSLRKTMERILLPLGRRIDELSPMVDARLRDGSRVHMVIPPLALDGPMISIRRFSNHVLSPEELLKAGTLDSKMLEFLKGAVEQRQNILVSGGTGSGKTTLLNILSSFIPEGERLVTIEEAAELRLNPSHTVRLEARPPNIEGKGEITIRDLVRNSLRMRPDRIIVGECRGAEALDMLAAMNTGHEGSLTTLHANNPRDALRRLETLVLFSGLDLPSQAIREQIASSIDLIIQIMRLSGGDRKIISIVKLVGLEGKTFTLQDCFQWENGFFQQCWV